MRQPLLFFKSTGNFVEFSCRLKKLSGQDPLLYRFVRKLSCSGVDQEGFPGLTPPPAAAENDLPIFQQNFASYLYKGNVGKVDQQTFSAVEKTITWCKADRQVGKCAAGCKISLNGVENQSVLAGFNVNWNTRKHLLESIPFASKCSRSSRSGCPAQRNMIGYKIKVGGSITANVIKLQNVV